MCQCNPVAKAVSGVSLWSYLFCFPLAVHFDSLLHLNSLGEVRFRTKEIAGAFAHRHETQASPTTGRPST